MYGQAFWKTMPAMLRDLLTEQAFTWQKSTFSVLWHCWVTEVNAAHNCQLSCKLSCGISGEKPSIKTVDGTPLIGQHCKLWSRYGAIGQGQGRYGMNFPLEDVTVIGQIGSGCRWQAIFTPYWPWHWPAWPKWNFTVITSCYLQQIFIYRSLRKTDGN